MTIWKKAISVATSAALLASLLATAVAPGAFAAVAETSAGNIAQGDCVCRHGDIPLHRESANAISLAIDAGGLDRHVDPPTPQRRHVTWAARRSSPRPGSLGVTRHDRRANVLRHQVTGQDPPNRVDHRHRTEDRGSAGAPLGRRPATLSRIGTPASRLLSQRRRTASGMLVAGTASARRRPRRQRRRRLRVRPTTTGRRPLQVRLVDLRDATLPVGRRRAGCRSPALPGQVIRR